MATEAALVQWPGVPPQGLRWSYSDMKEPPSQVHHTLHSLALLPTCMDLRAAGVGGGAALWRAVVSNQSPLVLGDQATVRSGLARLQDDVFATVRRKGGPVALFWDIADIWVRGTPERQR